MESILLSNIESVSRGELESKKLEALENGYDSFEAQLNSRNNSIALDKSGGTPYKIINGRHRIFLARQKGYSHVPAVIV